MEERLGSARKEQVGANLREGSYSGLGLRTGSGMDAATLKKAVEPFFSTKPVGKGTGLGLSMVHGLAVQLGGLLELSSEVGKGTTATLWLPIATNSLPVKEPAVLQVVTPGRPVTILVVDDDPLIAMSAVYMLEDLGHYNRGQFGTTCSGHSRSGASSRPHDDGSGYARYDGSRARGDSASQAPQHACSVGNRLRGSAHGAEVELAASIKTVSPSAIAG